MIIDVINRKIEYTKAVKIFPLFIIKAPKCRQYFTQYVFICGKRSERRNIQVFEIFQKSFKFKIKPTPSACSSAVALLNCSIDNLDVL